MAIRAPLWFAPFAALALVAGCDTGRSDAQRESEGAAGDTTTTTPQGSTGAAGTTMADDQGGQVAGDRQSELNQELTEARVKSAVYEQLQADARSVEVEVEQGTVRISGTIRNPENQKLAEAAAQKIPGVTQVTNELEVQAPAESRQEQPSPDETAEAQDRLIEAKVRASLLEQIGPDALNVDVSVDRGQVELSGNVRGADHKQHAISIAQGIAGVRGVRDSIDIRS